MEPNTHPPSTTSVSRGARRRLSPILAVAILAVVAGVGRAQSPQSLSLVAPPPPPVTTVTATASNPNGLGFYCWWVVAVYPIGKSYPTGPSCLSSAGGTVTVRWNAAPGATSYDVLRTSSITLPNGTASIAVATGVAGSSQTDTLGALSSYTIAAAPGATATIRLDNLLNAQARIYTDTPFHNLTVYTLTFGDGTTMTTAASGGISGLTTDAIVTAASATSVKTICATCTLDSSGNVSLPGTISLGVGAGVSGKVTLSGSTSGSAAIQVAAVAGSPAALNLPTATGGAGQFLSTDGGSPQQLSWSNAGTGTAKRIDSKVPTGTLTGNTTFFSTTVPANTMGAGQCIRIALSIAAVVRNSGTQIYTLNWGASSFAFQAQGAAGVWFTQEIEICNDPGLTNAQHIDYLIGGLSPSTANVIGGQSTATEDTTGAITLTLTTTAGNGTDSNSGKHWHIWGPF